MNIDLKLTTTISGAKEGIIGKINKIIGDQVSIGEVIMTIEASKGSTDLKATSKGTITSLVVEEGDSIKVGQLLGTMDGEKDQAKKSPNSYFSGILKAEKEELDTEITIIGAGPGGYVAAIQAAKMGAKVILIENEKLGGTCLNWGCIPTKALVRSAEVYKNCKEAESFGVITNNVEVDIKKMISRKNSVVEELVQGIEYLLNKHNVKIIKGKAEITDKTTVLVKSKRLESTIKTKDIIIATGSETSILNIQGCESKNILTSKEVLDIKELPKRMVIIGGGIIGMEFAFIFASLGVEVTVIEYFESILTCLDKDLCEVITNSAKKAGIKLFTGCKVEKILDSEDGQSIVCFSKEGSDSCMATDKVLMSVGRKPYFEGVGIEKIGVEISDKTKGIKVNEKMETSVENVYAIGDVTNIIQLAHVASHQGITAVKNILGEEEKISYDTVPSAIFTSPEIAMVGVTEKQAAKDNMDIKIGMFPFAANGKALTLGEKTGFVKLIMDNSTDKLIGGAIIGPHATDLISEITLAIQNNLTAEAIISTIHAHPTTAEALHEAALQLKTGAIHFA
ncbi:dihydrolipoyl dehydrogenase [Clostridium grantii]|uniref:Dihydrolipoyl dehydrogenase n=1 Tax=Clostridium grantii DSM 8605 TaxID=1121316 RepID=A0A1M5S364_9CLOT|nr:dihydrolipoyl dehydrogenase [Clostridium grantii]SHH32924.1 dihydrolipoamide dehydrogenase [Clostridium grantii DSM 8605]